MAIDNKTTAYLGKEFRHYKTPDLVRFGSKYDGGYVLSETDVKNTEQLISCGINTNWDFEFDFFSKAACEVDAYDASVSMKLFVRQFFGSMSRFEFYDALFIKFFKWVQFKRFFRGRVKFNKKYVGPPEFGNEYIELTEIFNQTKANQIFLKIDIEGGEYRILDQILEAQNRLSGLIIEFHDVDLHYQKVKQFIRQLDLSIIHLSVNDNQPLTKDGIPLVLEISFSANYVQEDILESYPTPLCRMNRPNGTLCKIEFEN